MQTYSASGDEEECLILLYKLDLLIVITSIILSGKIISGALKKCIRRVILHVNVEN